MSGEKPVVGALMQARVRKIYVDGRPDEIVDGEPVWVDPFTLEPITDPVIIRRLEAAHAADEPGS